MLNKKIAFIIFNLLTANTLAYGQNWGIPSSKPKLVVQIVVPQMHPDHLAQHWEKFGNDGFKLIFSNGINCTQVRYGHQHTQPYPNIATLSTGADPAVHGIVGNRWYSRSTNAEVLATADPKTQTIGGSFAQGQYSPKQLLCSTLPDQLRLSNPNSKTIGIALDAPSAILTTGSCATGAFWLDTERGRWISSTHYAPTLPSWADSLNTKDLALLYAQRDWRLLSPLTSYSIADTTGTRTPAQVKRQADKLQALSNGIIRSGQKSPTNLSCLLETPYGNSFTIDMAIAALMGEELGLDKHTDFLSITLSANRHIGTKFGHGSIEMEDTYLRLDRDLAHLLRFIDQQVGIRNTLIILTSDNSIGRSPEWLKDAGLPGGYFGSLLASTLINSYLSAIYGKGTWVLYCRNLQIYLNHKLIEEKKLNLNDIRQQVANFMLEFSGIARSIPAQSLAGFATGDAPIAAFQRSYNSQRSGDVLLGLNPGWAEEGSGIPHANTAWMHHSQVPLVICGWKVRQTTLHNPIDMTQLAPTLAKVLGTERPNGSMALPIVEIVKMLED